MNPPRLNLPLTALALLAGWAPVVVGQVEPRRSKAAQTDPSRRAARAGRFECDPLPSRDGSLPDRGHLAEGQGRAGGASRNQAGA